MSEKQCANCGTYHATISLKAKLKTVEEFHMRKVLAAHDGNLTTAAESLGIDRKTLRARLRGYALDAARKRG